MKNFETINVKNQQDDYEKRAEKKASAQNTMLQNIKNLFGGESFSKWDVIKADANWENEIRDKISVASPEEKEILEDLLEKIANSDLTYDFFKEDTVTHNAINGKIKDHNIKVEELFDTSWYASGGSWYRGMIDGMSITEDEARQIYFQYLDIAREKDARICQARKEWNEERERPGREKEAAKKLAEVKRLEEEENIRIKKQEEEKMIIIKRLEGEKPKKDNALKDIGIKIE